MTKTLLQWLADQEDSPDPFDYQKLCLNFPQTDDMLSALRGLERNGYIEMKWASNELYDIDVLPAGRNLL